MKTEYQNSIILKLKKIRLENEYSQKNIADILGISPGQLGNIESPIAPNKYTLKQIFALCNHFNTPIEDIFIEKRDLNTENNLVNLLITKIIKYGDR